MRILVLHKYGTKTASYRHRIQQYLPTLEAAGFSCEVSPLLDDAYVESRFSTGRRSLWGALKAVVRRLYALARVKRFDLVIVGVDLFPYCPAIFERALNLLGVPFIYDFDDPVFHYYDRHSSGLVRWALGGKVAEVSRRAELVFAGSPYLLDYAARAGGAAEYMPTVIDLDRYALSPRLRVGPEEPFVIGWIGSPTTAAAYLPLVEPALRAFCAAHPARLVVIGAGSYEPRGIPFESHPWSEADEVAELCRCDVGLMPLSDDSWARGKCGFKLIQYMACGLPVVASPVGVNSHIVEEGVSGFLAADDGQWVRALTKLAEDPAAAARMGLAGRRRVESEFCVQRTAPRFLEGVRRAIAAPRRRP